MKNKKLDVPQTQIDKEKNKPVEPPKIIIQSPQLLEKNEVKI